MTNLRTQFWLWLGKVLRVENGGVIDDGYAPRANQIPVVISPGKKLFVRDPFGVTKYQDDQAGSKVYQLKQERSLTGCLPSEKEKEYQILGAIRCVKLSEQEYSSDSFNPKHQKHWDDISTEAIDLLQSLGFQDNADIQRYLDKGELPNER